MLVRNGRAAGHVHPDREHDRGDRFQPGCDVHLDHPRHRRRECVSTDLVRPSRDDPRQLRADVQRDHGDEHDDDPVEQLRRPRHDDPVVNQRHRDVVDEGVDERLPLLRRLPDVRGDVQQQLGCEQLHRHQPDEVDDPDLGRRRRDQCAGAGRQRQPRADRVASAERGTRRHPGVGRERLVPQGDDGVENHRRRSRVLGRHDAELPEDHEFDRNARVALRDLVDLHDIGSVRCCDRHRRWREHQERHARFGHRQHRARRPARTDEVIGDIRQLHRGQRGISLIELIVAMSVSMIVLTAVGGFFAASLHASKTGSTAETNTRQASNVMNALTQYIHAATVLPKPDGTYANAITTATATDLAFYSYVNLTNGTVDQPEYVEFKIDTATGNLIEKQWDGSADAKGYYSFTTTGAAARTVTLGGPIASPTSDGTDLFTYLDASGAKIASPMANPSAVRAIQVNLELGSTKAGTASNTHIQNTLYLFNVGYSTSTASPAP
ncbi:hypothetical protein DEI92_01660 [Curtobacterium sp. MCBD17_034]|nr:hypothetical protein DEI92_01660 [Curtobacterium sp. MCBD17_034]PZM40124.1 hypothetical protein DEI90_04445 [Curtobacterium sp. MCBD17_031]